MKIVDMNWTTRNDTSQHLRQTAFVVSTDTTQSLPDPGNELACPLRLLVLLSDVGPMKSKRLKRERWSMVVYTCRRFGHFTAHHFAILKVTKIVLAGQASNSTIMFYDSVTGRWIHNIEMQKYAEMLLHFF